MQRRRTAAQWVMVAPKRCAQCAETAAATPEHHQKTYRAEALARLQLATLADCGFAERLWRSGRNHFCISANKGGLARDVGRSFEREAIRPFVLGRFRRHAEGGRAASGDAVLPRQSAIARPGLARGAESQAGAERKSRARNHGTAYARGRRGYSQDDVTSLARIITGWTYAGRQGQLGTPGSFVFNANAHQPARSG